MKGRIIFIRHGIAEKGNRKKDFDRRLTPKGRKEFQQFVPNILPMLKQYADLQLWTSPLVRARQTAEILSAFLNREPAEEKEFIGSGDWEELMEAIQQEDKDFSVVMVGHEPFLSSWVKELTGTAVLLEKGSALSVLLVEEEEQSGTIEWFLSPQQAKKHEVWDTVKKEKTPPPLLYRKGQEDVLLKRIFAERTAEIAEQLGRFKGNPEDPEIIHDFRVAVRKMRGLLSFFKPLMKKEEAETENARYRSAASALGKVRELDVLYEICADMAASGESSEVMPAALTYIQERREQELAELTRPENLHRLEQELQQAQNGIRELHFFTGKLPEDGLEEYIRTEIRRRGEKIKKRLAELDYSDHQKTHALRIEVKKLRYAVTYLGEAAGKEYKKKQDKLRKLQNKLGALCDYEINARKLADLADTTEDRELQKAFKRLSEEQRILRSQKIKVKQA